MATWTTIPDSSVEPGKPIRSIDTLAMRDNPVAIAEGAAGAPRVDLPAIVAALASVPVGSIGSYALLYRLVTIASSNVATGGTLSGSNLRYAGVAPARGITGSAPSGTWRLMGSDANAIYESVYEHSTSLWLRIA